LKWSSISHLDNETFMNDNIGLNEAARKRIQIAYNPKLLETAGHRLVDLLTDHLRKIESSTSSVLNWTEPPDLVKVARASLSHRAPYEAASSGCCDELVRQFEQLARQAFSNGNNLHDPRYVGHQVPASVPIAGLFDALGAVTNQVMAVYEMGPWATAIERALVDELGRLIGWMPGEFAGLITHGGSLANLTALLTARNVVLDQAWTQGVDCGSPRPVMVVHSDAHYSVARAIGILGLGTDNLVRAPLDEQRRMDPDQLDALLTALIQKGHTVVAVASAACATPIGAFDPVDAIAEVCQKHKVWLHVDAAHGGSACLSRRHRHLVAGLDQADSVVWDAHKMLFMPALCAFVFYRNPAHRFDAFQQNAPYLFDPSNPGIAEYDSGLKTVECTKRAAAMGLWGTWSLFGPQLFEDMVDVTFDLGRVLYEKLLAAPDFEPLHEPQCNIVAFRHMPEALRQGPAERIGPFQLELRRTVIQSGEFYLVPTQVNGIGALRVTLINPLTTPDHLDALMDALRRYGKTLLES
jgi:L-2,4-diaminobutyrate decarboxylase